MSLQVRLANRSSIEPYSGRVEVFYNGSWGTVCDDGWSLQDANIVCNQLGYGNAKQAVGRAHFGAGSGHIWLDEVQCSPGADSLSDCLHNPIGMTDCTHAEDAGVICEKPGKNFMYFDIFFLIYTTLHVQAVLYVLSMVITSGMGILK